MDVRIGVTYSPKEILVEFGDDADRDAIKASAATALGGGEPVLWLTDKRGREVGVSAEKIAYIEIGNESESKIGFGG